MSQFEYLSVLISIIIGLAITQLLSGAARLIQIRRRVRLHAATLCWMVSMFLLDTQIWWVAFERQDNVDWNFFLFLLYLLMPIGAFLLSYLVLPELGDEDSADLAANFEENRPWFFGVLALLPGISLLEEWSHDARLPLDGDVAFRIGFIALSLAGARIRNARFHFWYALVALALICAYIAVLFLRLR
jgi:hypothetical protein